MDNTQKANTTVRSTPQRQTKVYGIHGLTEITVTIPAGKAWMMVHFTGGALTGYGVTPATFTTANPNVQALIERSPQFCSGRIKRLK